jgi:hypothetical protein
VVGELDTRLHLNNLCSMPEVYRNSTGEGNLFYVTSEYLLGISTEN